MTVRHTSASTGSTIDSHPSSVLLAQLSPKTRSTLTLLPDLDNKVRALLKRARSRWPAIDYDGAQFIADMANCIDRATDPVGALCDLRWEELYLARACAHHNPTALAIFETDYMPSVAASLSRQGLSPQLADEALQRVRMHLFCGHEERPGGAIVTYGGRGQLAGWLRIVALRIARRLQRQERDHQRHEIPVEDDLEKLTRALPAEEDGLELQHLRHVYGEEFRRAFSAAMSHLTKQEQTILAMHLIDGLAPADIAKSLRLHKSNVSRRLATLRRKLLDGTRRTLMERLSIGETSCDSILRLIASQIEVSFGRLAAELMRTR